MPQFRPQEKAACSAIGTRAPCRPAQSFCEPACSPGRDQGPSIRQDCRGQSASLGLPSANRLATRVAPHPNDQQEIAARAVQLPILPLQRATAPRQSPPEFHRSGPSSPASGSPDPNRAAIECARAAARNPVDAFVRYSKLLISFHPPTDDQVRRKNTESRKDAPFVDLPTAPT